MSAGLPQPPVGIRVADKPKEPAKDRQAIVSAEAKTDSVWCKNVSEVARVVLHGSDGVGDQMSDSARVLIVIEEIRGDPRRPSHGKTADGDPLSFLKRPLVKPDVRLTCLASLRECEVMTICGKMAKPVQGCGGAVRDHALVGRALPCRDTRRELEPGRANFLVL
ncbi:MAG: hypothetical protein WEE66_03115 [Actinomycetota bacterium]